MCMCVSWFEIFVSIFVSILGFGIRFGSIGNILIKVWKYCPITIFYARYHIHDTTWYAWEDTDSAEWQAEMAAIADFDTKNLQSTDMRFQTMNSII